MHKQRSGDRCRTLSQLVHDVPVVGVAAATATSAAAIVVNVIGTVAFDGVFVDMVGAESGRGWVADGTAAAATTAVDRSLGIAPTRAVVDGPKRWLRVGSSSEATNRRADDRTPAPRLGWIPSAAAR